MVNSPDVTYSKGYLGLLSIVGAFFSICSCCGFCLQPIARTLSKYFGRKPRGFVRPAPAFLAADPADPEDPEDAHDAYDAEYDAVLWKGLTLSPPQAKNNYGEATD